LIEPSRHSAILAYPGRIRYLTRHCFRP
jgi:hypothetical protein